MHSPSDFSVAQAVRSRKSVRAFLGQEVPRPLLEEVLTLAARAPSGGNLQPWRLRVLSGEAMVAFKSAMQSRVREAPEGEAPFEYEIYPKALGEPYRTSRFDIGERLYASIGVARDDKAGRRMQFQRNFDFFGAPAAVLCFADRRMGPPQWADLGMYLQTVMLLLRERGLHSCPQEAWSLYHQTVRAFVSAPPEWLLFCGMAIGYEDPAAPVNAIESPRVGFHDFAAWVPPPA
ncbi:MAG TPA: nitroreductase family protein [Burkholderiaceae bacterium]|nr:nitroreductase family protein [Burkholderiaceae bacterium]